MQTLSKTVIEILQYHAQHELQYHAQHELQYHAQHELQYHAQHELQYHAQHELQYRAQHELQYNWWDWLVPYMSPTWAPSWENLIMAYVNNKGTDQPGHPCSLISTFVVHFLDSIITSTCYIQTFKTRFCSWAGGFESYQVENPEDRFSRDKAHIIPGIPSVWTHRRWHTCQHPRQRPDCFPI